MLAPHPDGLLPVLCALHIGNVAQAILHDRWGVASSDKTDDGNEVIWARQEKQLDLPDDSWARISALWYWLSNDCQKQSRSVRLEPLFFH